MTRREPALRNDAVIASGVVKDFGATRALDHLDLTVHTGEVHGFLGPNAGKTLFAVSMGLTAWQVLVAGPMFGPSLNLPAPVRNLSPFTHSPKAPAVAVSAVPLLALTVVAVGLAVTGLATLRRRNLILPA